MKSVSEDVDDKIKKKKFYVQYFENLAIYEAIKKILERDRPQMTIWRM
jgi:hypothetical protein